VPVKISEALRIRSRKSVALARWVAATVFLEFLENLPGLAIGHESGEYLAQHVFFCGCLVGEEDHLLKLHPAMNGFEPNLERMILLLGIEIFPIITEEQVSLIFWVIRHLALSILWNCLGYQAGTRKTIRISPKGSVCAEGEEET
jgi:hypothetical protein